MCDLSRLGYVDVLQKWHLLTFKYRFFLRYRFSIEVPVAPAKHGHFYEYDLTVFIKMLHSLYPWWLLCKGQGQEAVTCCL